jgi:pimeloyl-ACP methyl ester carboxylesterase
VTYDPRGIGHSTREDTTPDITPATQADDVHRLLSALGGGPAAIFGSSGGAVVGLALVAAHPDEVSTLVAHEPPVIELLPDRDQVRAQFQDVYDTYRADGIGPAMARFMVRAGLYEPPAHAPVSPEQLAEMYTDAEVFLAHLLRPTTNYRPDIEALRSAPTRIATPATEFPGDHGGFVTHPAQSAQVLHQLLTHST